MSTQICPLCNTELLDNLISCSGRCNKFFHYTCVGLSRTTFDVYKKVEGLRWQCTDCTNDFKGIWSKLDELAKSVNDMKSMISVSGMVKAAVREVFRDNKPASCSSVNPNIQSTESHERKGKRKRNNRKKVPQSSTPINVSTIQPTASLQSLSQTTDPSAESSANTTVVPNDIQTIRTAEKRLYLWLNGFHHDTTSQQVIKLVASTLCIQESEVICRSLKSSRRTYTDFDQISFRVGLKESVIGDGLSADRWPKGVICKLFKSKNSINRQPVKLG